MVLNSTLQVLDRLALGRDAAALCHGHHRPLVEVKNVRAVSLARPGSVDFATMNATDRDQFDWRDEAAATPCVGETGDGLAWGNSVNSRGCAPGRETHRGPARGADRGGGCVVQPDASGFVSRSCWRRWTEMTRLSSATSILLSLLSFTDASWPLWSMT